MGAAGGASVVGAPACPHDRMEMMCRHTALESSCSPDCDNYRCWHLDEVSSAHAAPDITKLPTELIREVGHHFQFCICLRKTLRALTTTSHHFRTIFLPLLWEDVCMCAHVDPARLLTVSLPIVPIELGRFVRTLTFSLFSFSESSDTLSLLVQVLNTLPDLRSLAVSHIPAEAMSDIQVAFEGQKLPSVTSLAVPVAGLPIARSCPNITTLTYLRPYSQGNPSIYINKNGRVPDDQSTSRSRNGDLRTAIMSFLHEVTSVCRLLDTLKQFPTTLTNDIKLTRLDYRYTRYAVKISRRPPGSTEALETYLVPRLCVPCRSRAIVESEPMQQIFGFIAGYVMSREAALAWCEQIKIPGYSELREFHYPFHDILLTDDGFPEVLGLMNDWLAKQGLDIRVHCLPDRSEILEESEILWSMAIIDKEKAMLGESEECRQGKSRLNLQNVKFLLSADFD